MDIANDLPQQDTGVLTETAKPEVEESRAALVKDWQDKVKRAKDFHEKKAFKQMRANMRLAAKGADETWVKDNKYVVPILVRYINQAVAQLYAKNPKAVAKRKRKMMFKLWDGRPDSLQIAMQSAMMGDPNALAIVMEAQAALQQMQMLDRMAETLEILFEYYINEQAYDYKAQIKAAVRRVKVCKVAYCKLGFQRILEARPEIMARIEDATSKVGSLECILNGVAEGDIDEASAQMEEMRLLLADLQTQTHLIVREGPVYDFPRAEKIIVDPDCIHLKSFAGARWVAQEFELTPKEVYEIYKVEVSGSYTQYKETERTDKEKGKDCKARIVEIWDKKNQQVMTICEGYPDFLKEPAEPDIKLERFWPFFALVFNEIEHDEDIYPPSDVENARHIQEEYNRSREALREHRIAARPWWVASSMVEETELKKIGDHAAHEVIQIKQIAAGGKIQDLIMAGPAAPIDPNLYEVEMHFTDLMRTVGIQEANLGATAGGTATESSIAEQSRGTSLADNVDDLDEWLTDIAKATGQLMLMELTKDTVIEIAGPGAVWPDMPETREEVAKDLYLEIQAGSSGRPNRAAELANLERGAPILVQLPGVKPEPLAKRYLELLEIDLEETIVEGMPSITAINAMMTAQAKSPAPGGEPTGDPATDPNQQGGQGGNNAPGQQQNQNEPGPQPAFPAPMPVG